MRIPSFWQSTHRAATTDEVNVADTEWLATTARLFVRNDLVNVPMSRRDSVAIEAALSSVLKASNIEPWMQC